MNKEVKQKWAKALKSGKYKQGDNCLRSLDNKFCCAGVLTDIYAKEKGIKWKKLDDNYGIGQYSENAIIPSDVNEWADLNNKETMGYQNSIYYLNDDLGLTFEEIAVYVKNGL